MQAFKKVLFWWLTFSVTWGVFRLTHPPELLSEVIAKPLVWIGLTFLFFRWRILPENLTAQLKQQFLQTKPFWRIFLLPVVFITLYFVFINFRQVHLPAFSLPLLAVTLLINFATAIVEEYIYRGVMYVWLLDHTSEAVAFILVQVLFLLGHLPVLLLTSNSVAVGLSHAFFILYIGAIHTAIFRMNKSLYSSILSHGVWNSLSYYLLLGH